MESSLVEAWAQVGAFAALSLSAIGSGLGAGTAGMAAVGAWKRCFVQNKPAPFLLVAFVGAPLSQTIYGFLVMLAINAKIESLHQTMEMGQVPPSSWPALCFAGVFAGLAMGMSAWMQGKAAAGACDAFGESGKGFANDLTVLGIVETVALFVMVFTMISLPF
jgi:V/A-type H+/Na+-transporting ATPase subunit K